MVEGTVNADGKREIDPATLDAHAVYKIMAGCIVPRPIGFISTVDRAGVFNAAPFSFFNMVSHLPPMISVAIAQNRSGDGPKDTLANILDGGDFVVNVVSEDIVGAVDLCSEYQPPEIDEIALSGLTAVTSARVKSPRIGESPVSFECSLASRVDLEGSLHTLILGRIVHMHIRDDVLLSNGRIDQVRMAAVGRMAGSVYCRTRDTFETAHDGFAVIERHANVLSTQAPTGR